MDRKSLNIFIFSIATLVLLLRPYAIYRITQQNAIAKNPAKVYSLLQRLLKKKDENHNPEETYAVEIRRLKYYSQQRARLRRSLNSIILSVSPLTDDLALLNEFQRHRPEKDRYRLISCFLI